MKPSAIALRGMLGTDALRMIRDRFLIGMTVYCLLVFPLLVWVLPWMTGVSASEWDFDLVPYHGLIITYFAVQLIPWLPGMVGGFLLLDSRESNVLKALLVSSTPLWTYLLFMCAVMFAAAFALTLGLAALMGRGLVSGQALIFVSLAAAPFGPLFALLLATISKNKVQAFAYMKLFGVAPLAVVGCYFLPANWHWLAAIYPPFCASKAYWVAEAGGASWPIWVVAGYAGSGIWLGVLCHLFLRAARK